MTKRIPKLGRKILPQKKKSGKELMPRSNERAHRSKSLSLSLSRSDLSIEYQMSITS